VLRAIPDGPVIIATGGVSTGAQIAGLLTQGAEGVALGTRFLFTDESKYSPAMKEVLVAADLNATERGMVFDEVNRTMGWPEGINGRAIANDIFRDYLDGAGLEERMRKYDESEAKGHKNRLVIWAGVGVGMTTDINSTTVWLLLDISSPKLNKFYRMSSTSCMKMRLDL
jgi:nitronate monooxygenase